MEYNEQLEQRLGVLFTPLVGDFVRASINKLSDDEIDAVTMTVDMLLRQLNPKVETVAVLGAALVNVAHLASEDIGGSNGLDDMLSNLGISRS